MKRLRGRACRLRVQRQRDIKDRGVFVELQIIESGWRIMRIYACVCVGGCFREKVAGDEHGEVGRDRLWVRLRVLAHL